MEILFSFNFGFYVEGQIVNERKLIMQSYLSYKFWIDTLTVSVLIAFNYGNNKSGIFSLILLALRMGQVRELINKIDEYFQI
jgi:hypothetical protein